MDRKWQHKVLCRLLFLFGISLELFLICSSAPFILSYCLLWEKKTLNLPRLGGWFPILNPRTQKCRRVLLSVWRWTSSGQENGWKTTCSLHSVPFIYSLPSSPVRVWRRHQSVPQPRSTVKKKGIKIERIEIKSTLCQWGDTSTT